MQKNEDSQTPSPSGFLVCPPEVNRTPSVCLLSTWKAMELVPNGGQRKSPTSVTLSRSPVGAECAAGLPARGSGSPSLGAPRGSKGGRVCPVTAHMNDSRVREQFPFLDGFF